MAVGAAIVRQRVAAAIEGATVDAYGEIYGSHGECVRLLLEAGADPRARDVPPGQVEEVKRREGGSLNEHWSALHRAALRGLPQICSLLLATGLSGCAAPPMPGSQVDAARLRAAGIAVDLVESPAARASLAGYLDLAQSVGLPPVGAPPSARCG